MCWILAGWCGKCAGSSIYPVSILSLDTFKYTRRKAARPSLTFSYEYSTTLLKDSWNPFTVAAESSNGGEPIEEITVTLPDDLLTQQKLFLQIKANQ